MIKTKGSQSDSLGFCIFPSRKEFYFFPKLCYRRINAKMNE